MSLGSIAEQGPQGIEERLAVEEYRALLQLISYEGREYWSRFNALFGINAAVLTVIGALGVQTSSASFLPSLVPFISMFGFVAATVWLFISFRAHAFYTFWIERAKQIEKAKPFQNYTFLKTFEEMGKYFDKLPVYKRIPVLSAPYAIVTVLLLVYPALPFIFQLSLLTSVLTLVIEILVIFLFALWGCVEKSRYATRKNA